MPILRENHVLTTRVGQRPTSTVNCTQVAANREFLLGKEDLPKSRTPDSSRCPLNRNPKRRRGIFGQKHMQPHPSVTSRFMKTRWADHKKLRQIEASHHRKTSGRSKNFDRTQVQSTFKQELNHQSSNVPLATLLGSERNTPQKTSNELTSAGPAVYPSRSAV